MEMLRIQLKALDLNQDVRHPGVPGRPAGAGVEIAVAELRRAWCLTLAETCLLYQAAMGTSDRMLAFRLNRSPSTIRRNWQSIREKSGFTHHRRAVFEVWARSSYDA